MTEKQTPRFGGTLSSESTPINNSKKKLRLRRPPGLVLSKASRPTTFNLGATSEASAACGICSQELSPNSRLCSDCQIWNDAHHMFQCLREAGTWEKRTFVTLQEVLGRKECLICEAVGRAVLTKLATSEVGLEKELAKVEIMNCGPYCFGQDALNALNPDLLRKYGRHRIDPNDLRLPSVHLDDTKTIDAADHLKIVLYLVITAAPGSKLQKHFIELDSYKTSDMDQPPMSEADKFVLGIRRKVSDDESVLLQPTIGLQLGLRYANQKRVLLEVGSWEHTYIDLSLVSHWLRNCNATHTSTSRTNKPKCNLSTDQVPLPSGFRAIDTQRLCVVELASTPHPSYAALSYTWGATSGIKELQLELANKEELRKESSLQERSGIPDIILDAIVFCIDMGVQYLWVDRLCIVQDDLESKMVQIKAMDRIYHIASFTIVAAVPLGVGLPGVRNRPRKSSLANYSRRFHPNLRFVVDNFKLAVMDSFWNTRGWTYQERILSRRTIYITEWQTYFLCNQGAEQEETGGFAASVNPWDLHRFATYVTTVADYTSRNLTFGSDILNAFVGIGNRFEMATGKPLLQGLPERHFPQALLWEHDGESRRREGELNIPSWSWAAWVGRSKYDTNSSVEKLSFGTLVRFYIRDPDHDLRRIDADEVWFWKIVDLEALDKLPVIDPLYPEKRFMPDGEATETAWRECPQNPWTVTQQGGKSRIATTALAHLGKLVFRTTSAIVALRSPVSHNHVGTPGYVKLDIVANDNTIVGQIAQLPEASISKHVNLGMKHRIVVIAAGIASEPARYAQTHSTLHVSGNMQEPRATESAWYLHVMLIDETSSSVSQRIGIGTVEMRTWKDLEPEWCNVVLA